MATHDQETPVSTAAAIQVAVEAGPNPNISEKVSLPTFTDNIALLQGSAANGAPPSATFTSTSAIPTQLHVGTPLVLSDVLSKKTGHNVFLKLDCLQPSGSFKIRGIGSAVLAAFKEHGHSAHILCSSGGNAGLAAATACQLLSRETGGLKCSIFVPNTCEEAVKVTLRKLGAAVTTVDGSAWDHADAAAREMLASDKHAVYIHPFIGDDLTKGHASIPKEVYAQMEEQYPAVGQLDLLCCTVGGGGMIHGILQGLADVESSRTGFTPPMVIACQDFGADSFNQSMNAFLADPKGNAEAHVTLDAITSKATSMGTKQCSGPSLAKARRYALSGSVSSNPRSSNENERFLSTVTLEDALSASACWQFRRDTGQMVELSCGAALAPVYHSQRLLPALLEGRQVGGVREKKNIVIVVCGGSKVDNDMLDGYQRDFGEMKGSGKAAVNGQPV